MSEEINADTLQEILISAKEDLQKVLDEARQKFEELGSHFVDQGIGVLCQGLGVYGHLYKRSGLQDREALDIAISKSHNVVKEAALDLLEIESELAAAGCHVVVVTFGVMSGAERWRLETACPFPYYTDPSHALYQLLGLKRSVASVWNTATLSYYGAQIAKGIPLPESYTDIEDDPHQMGGDFILDKQSKLQFVYRSKVPNDRPSVDLILTALKVWRRLKNLWLKVNRRMCLSLSFVLRRSLVSN
ncbi:uncharacterized protein LOC121864128 isoform X1 [Homarus americanus]|uniref:uncharacterized protein LOC121864128 isoform X1 n=1 Tax=Homarus americanus TaxID=6706 RepID=UPI001C4924DD|nr:uncharacterized protein LOC121864128 isoform X1 [Homarus americanus]